MISTSIPVYLQSPPAPATLHWLSEGLLGSRFLRTMRLWDCLQHFYGAPSIAQDPWPDAFSYPDWRDRRFAPSHNSQELATPHQIHAACQGTPCLCQQSSLTLLWGDVQPPGSWLQDMAQLAHLSQADLGDLLQQSPFAVVHRVLRNDLQALVHQGFLSKPSRGRYRCLTPQTLPLPPAPPQSGAMQHPLASLSDSQCWDVMRALEAVAFLQPSLEPIIQQIWEHQYQQSHPALPTATAQRVFFEVNYIFAESDRDRVDTYQFQLEQLWQSAVPGVIQFESWLPHQHALATATVYPVCIHYTRRAKYLSAYGTHADGTWGWHNYRLDRIRSQQLRLLPWGDPTVPDQLRDLWRFGSLPTPTAVLSSLEEAWGFNFYLPKVPMILRFNRRFAQDYVTQTQRHETFQAIDYPQILHWLTTVLGSRAELQTTRELLAQRSAEDAYFRAWIRLGDINITMRLREWRPAGEVIYPLELRKMMLEELEQEQNWYKAIDCINEP